MRKTTLLLIACLLLMGALPSHAASAKKGVNAADDPGPAGAAMTALDARWYYTWASDRRGIQSNAEFVPMIWGAAGVTDAELTKAKANGRQLLGFNEPDMAGQANTTVERALDLWPRLQNTGLRLGAPGVAFGGDVAGGWLDRFMAGAKARNLRVDFIPLHWYGQDFSSAATGHLESYLRNVHNRYKKPIWLTEYALIDWRSGRAVYPSQQQQTAFITASTRMLDGLSFVERYSWFTLSTKTSPTGLSTGTALTAAGQAYRPA
ncbi:glycoside hydrolase family protein [Lentzea sp. NPDC102401]|uniref:glycoside hydrolase family protein n=1 Tax=Lentzea sp. NPDC102401 TaxID=3364128 RepID=UPI0037F68C26